MRAEERNEELTLRPYTKSENRKFSPTFYELAAAYYKAKSATMPQASLYALEQKLDNIILPEIGRIEVLRLSAHRLDQFIRKRRKGGIFNGKRRGPVKLTTIHRDLCDIQAICNWGVKRKYIKINPVAGYEKPRRDDEIIRPPSLDETEAIVKHAAPHLVRAICLSYYTGLRPGLTELFLIRWSDIDFSEKILVVKSAAKGGPRSRSVPIHQDFLTLLKQWFEEDGKEDNYIITYKGKSVRSIRTAFAAAKRRAKITRRLRPYDLRHAFATAVLKRYGDLKSVSEIIGHSRTDTTSRVYQHTDTDLHRDTIDKLPSLDIGQ